MAAAATAVLSAPSVRAASLSSAGWATRARAQQRPQQRSPAAAKAACGCLPGGGDSGFKGERVRLPVGWEFQLAQRARRTTRQSSTTQAVAAGASAPSAGRPGPIWRILGCIGYVLPLIEVLMFGKDVYAVWPFFRLILVPFEPLLYLYHSNGLTPFVVFFCLFLFVCRNPRVPHFVRFNAMQAILLDICLMLAGLLISYLPEELASSAVGALANNATFLVCCAAVTYCLGYTLRGTYADIPIVSEATYLQLQ
eukprot:jgi/Chlat1/896/Chrsp107S01334